MAGRLACKQGVQAWQQAQAAHPRARLLRRAAQPARGIGPEAAEVIWHGVASKDAGLLLILLLVFLFFLLIFF
jgi:hypothetical protein